MCAKADDVTLLIIGLPRIQILAKQ